MLRKKTQLLVLLSLTLAGCAILRGTSNPVLAPSQSAANYYPLQRGWGWAYNVEQGGKNVLAVYSVISNDGQTATILNVGNQITYAVTNEGIARWENGTPGDFLLKNPIAKNARWAVLGGEATVVAIDETVTLPSGSYPRCIIIEERRHLPERITRTTYAQEVGPIEIEMRVQDPVSGSFETSVHARLLSVTLPETDLKDEKK